MKLGQTCVYVFYYSFVFTENVHLLLCWDLVKVEVQLSLFFRDYVVQKEE